VTEGSYPSYSPDGKRIVYAGFDGNDNSEIYTINADGGGKENVTNNEREDIDPDYSPDGKRIAFAGWDGNAQEIYTIDAGGGGKSRVTDTLYFTSGPSWGSRP
jgi:Tol biopolymer transport system component